MLFNLHVPKAHFNLVSSWFILRDCLHLPPRHASLLLIISYKQCIICVSSKRRLLQPSYGYILFWSVTRFTNTLPVQCLTAPVSGNSMNREIIIPAIWVSPGFNTCRIMLPHLIERMNSVGYSFVPQRLACRVDLQQGSEELWCRWQGAELLFTYTGLAVSTLNCLCVCVLGF